jgi:hypothetical protein
MEFCDHGDKYDRDQCQRDDCPCARLGYRSRHVAFPKLQELRSQGQLVNRCPDLNLYDLQNYVGRAGQEHHEKRKHHRDRKPRQPEGPPPNVASSSSGDNPVKLGRIDDSWYHSDGKHLEATQVEPSPPSEAATGHAVSTQVWLTLLLLPVFSALCPLNEVVRLACTSRMALEPTVAGHLAFIQHLWRMLSRRPTSSMGRHHRDQTPMQPEGPPPNVASPSSGGNPVKLEPVAVNRLWRLEQEIEPYEAVTTEDFMNRAAEQTRRWQAAGTATSSQASRRDLEDLPAPASHLINMCLQCEMKPGIDWPLGLLCKECYEGLSETK